MVFLFLITYLWRKINSKNKLEDFKKNFKNSKLILVLTKESEIQEKGSISSISFEDLSEDIKKWNFKR